MRGLSGLGLLGAAAVLLLAAGCASSSSEGGTAQVAASEASGAQSEGDEVICRRVQRTGSHLGSERVCRTQAEWNQANRDDQAFVNNNVRGGEGSIESSVR